MERMYSSERLYGFEKLGTRISMNQWSRLKLCPVEREFELFSRISKDLPGTSLAKNTSFWGKGMRIKNIVKNMKMRIKIIKRRNI